MDKLDLVIRNGTILDGSGADPYVADIGIVGDRIVAIGPQLQAAGEEIEAKDKIVTPGFVDVHTHYDGQAIWSDRLSPSSAHGVTTVVAGNCGVGFAPCRREDHDLLINVMEGVEDIPEVVMSKGLDWHWESFPEYLDALEAQPRDIDIAVYLPHSPLRVYVMGERGAAREAATPEDLRRMRALMSEAIDAGALGFASSWFTVHRTADGQQIPSFEASDDELEQIAAGMTDRGTGTLQAVLNTPFQPWDEQVSRLIRLAEACGRPATFSFVVGNGSPDEFSCVLPMLEEANSRGVQVTAQVLPRPIGVLSGIELSINPFTLCASYKPLAEMPFEQRLAEMRKPEVRAQLLSEPLEEGHPIVMLSRSWKWMYPMLDPPNYAPSREESVWARAAEAGVTPEEWAYDYLIAGDGRNKFFGAMGNFPQGKLDGLETMLKHPNCIVGLGDGGAHYGSICDASYPTFLLTHWVKRDRRLTLPEAIHTLARKPALAVGLADRGLLSPGVKADLNVIDLDELRLPMPFVAYDLPAGGRRLDQRATGYEATIVSGQVIRRFDEPTAALPGKLIRAASRSIH